VETVRAYFDAWNRRDLGRMAEVLHAGVEWRRSADFPEGRTLRGSESMLDFARSMWEVFVETPIDSVRNGAVSRVNPYPSREEALAAVRSRPAR
jgi:SnoaL-like protein